MKDAFYNSEALNITYSKLIVTLGYSSPYLMDEIIGLAAAHRSTTVQDDSSRDFYRQEATRLQTRALAQFNAIQPIEKQHALSVFMFSTLLGQHVLFDTFSSGSDFSSVLDRFVDCLSLHRGIRTIVSELYPSIIAQLEELDGPDSAMAREMGVGARTMDGGDDCSPLVDMLRQSNLSSTEAEAYDHAVDALQQMFNNQRGSSHQRYTVVQAWPVRVSVDYVHLLAQRRPESLIILAFYGILLHKARESWTVAGAGRFLVESITSHLGSYWAGWLKIPNKMLGLP
ncbi:hypothetical protein N3K66_006200 [Trichothecium roseum]|uniref:Uncharacterized protein n=1 Tax=Trichothecium roseum TaxID=47278 RepID=A0ACC0V001_9HYPO|nr:hypothetical protein N3K66_006200 [Trichothecium roseum]